MTGLNRKLLMTEISSEFSPIRPEYRTLNVQLWAIITAVIAAVAVVTFVLPESISDMAFVKPTRIVSILLAVLTMTVIIYHWFADIRVRYRVGERDVTLKKGIFFRKETCQPLKRIQHIEIKRGPLERRRDLSSLYVYSAGGHAHTLAIPGLSTHDAETLKEWILSHKDTMADY